MALVKVVYNSLAMFCIAMFGSAGRGGPVREPARGWFLAFLFWLLLSTGCEVERGGLPGQTGAPAVPVSFSGAESQSWKERSAEARKAKDKAFQEAESPLADSYRAGFKGLSYYPIDPRYCFQGRIYRLPQGQFIRMAASDGEMRKAIHWGYFRFQLSADTICTLQVYKMIDPDPRVQESLFLPFIDAGAGKETYGGGRFLDLEEKAEGDYIVDFNQAYNPYCAYGKKYSCPVPPRENRLSVAIPAGEKIFVREDKTD